MITENSNTVPTVSGASKGEGQFVMTFDTMVKIVRRRWRGIMISVLLSFSSVMAYHFMQTPEYHAVSMMMINENRDRPGEDLFNKVVGPEPGIFETNMSVRKDAELIKSMTIAEKTVLALVSQGRSASMELFGAKSYVSPVAMLFQPLMPLFAGHREAGKGYTDQELRLAAERLNRRIRVDQVRETNLIKVSVASPFREEAELLSNTLCSVYKELNVRQNSEKYAQANRFIGLMLDEQGRKLSEADAALARHMSSHEIYEMTGNTEELLKKLVDIDARYNDFQAEYNITRNNLSFLDKKLSEAEKAVGSRIAQSVNGQLGSIIDEVRGLETEYLKTVKDHGIDSPEARGRKQQLDLAKSRYEELSRSKIAGQIGYVGRTQKYSFEMISEKLQVERKLNDLNVSAREYGRLKHYYEAQLAHLPVKQQEYVRLLRNREAISKTYVFLKEKLDESRILLGSEVGSVAMIGNAIRPLKPEKPSMKKTLLLGLLLSGVISVAYTYGAEKKDDLLYDDEPLLKQGCSRIFRIPEMVDNPKSARIAESFRLLRAHLDYQTSGQDGRLLMVSGVGAHEGSSTVCLNVGTSWAGIGRKVLIIDGNMVHASLHRSFDMPNEGGLAGYLTGQSTDAAGLPQSTDYANLDFIPAGEVVSNQSDLLGSDSMKRLLALMKERYDRVLLNAPSLLLSDSIQMVGLVDGILMVARLGHSSKRSVATIMESVDPGDKAVCVAMIGPDEVQGA